MNLLRFLPAWIRRALYFGLQTLIGSRIYFVWKEFLAWERFTAAEHDAAVEKKLSKVLEFASAHSEYYRRLKIERRPGESAKDWLKRFPVLERALVRQHFSDIVTDKLRGEIPNASVSSPKKYGWLIVKTGGTTGVPTTVVHDAETRDWGRVTRLYGLKSCGFPLGTPYIRLWGSEQDLLKQNINLQQKVLRALHAEVPLNAFKARESDLLEHLKVIRDHSEIQHLMAYVDAAAGLAMFVRDKKIPAPKFKKLMACAGTVTPEYRELLEETFSAEVFDKYGSRECCDMACECSEHKGMHIYSPQAFIEIVDEKGNECSPGKQGRILVTMLNNLSFPMVRYSIGDISAWMEPGLCPCGLPFPRMQNVSGREDDMLTTEDGTMQSSVFVRHFVGVSLNRQLIREWQLEQVGAKDFIFRYVPLSENGLNENLAKLKETFLLVFGKSVRVEMLRVETIPPAPTGKVRWIINTYRKKNEI